jgi:hypothetical protein
LFVSPPVYRIDARAAATNVNPILGRERMSLWACGHRRPARTDHSGGATSHDVLGMGDWLKMIRVDAASVRTDPPVHAGRVAGVTEMIEFHALGDWPDEMFVSIAMRWRVASEPLGLWRGVLPIPAPSGFGHPDPATGGLDIDPR